MPFCAGADCAWHGLATKGITNPSPAENSRARQQRTTRSARLPATLLIRPLPPDASVRNRARSVRLQLSYSCTEFTRPAHSRQSSRRLSLILLGRAPTITLGSDHGYCLCRDLPRRQLKLTTGPDTYVTHLLHWWWRHVRYLLSGPVGSYPGLAQFHSGFWRNSLRLSRIINRLLD